MHTEITHKVPNGKLLRITLEYDTTTLEKIRICGDFFCHPEETIEGMEKALNHLPVEAKPERIKHVLDEVVAQKKAQLVGFDTETLSKLISEAINP